MTNHITPAAHARGVKRVKLKLQKSIGTASNTSHRLANRKTCVNRKSVSTLAQRKGLCDLSWCPYIIYMLPTKILKCSQNAYYSSLTMPLLHERPVRRQACASTFSATNLQLLLYEKKQAPPSLAIQLCLLNYYFLPVSCNNSREKDKHPSSAALEL